MRFVATCLGGLAVLILSGGLTAGEKGKTMVKVGDKAPTFQGVDENGKVWKSTDHVGKKIVVLFFYPAALTGGWTAQACGFRDEAEKLGKGVEVLGVSGDTPEGQKLFQKEKSLPFHLLADEKGDIAKKFGVPVGKGGTFKYKDANGESHVLKRGVTISRYHVVIDRNGNIADIAPVSKAADDAKRVCEIVEKLEKK